MTPVFTGRKHDPWTRVSKTTPVFTGRVGYTGDQHGLWTRVSFFDTRVHGPCPRPMKFLTPVFTGRGQGPWTRSVDTGSVYGALLSRHPYAHVMYIFNYTFIIVYWLLCSARCCYIRWWRCCPRVPAMGLRSSQRQPSITLDMNFTDVSRNPPKVLSVYWIGIKCGYGKSDCTPCLKKRPTFTYTTCYNFYVHRSIATIFGTSVAEKVGNQNVLYFPTSPD